MFALSVVGYPQLPELGNFLAIVVYIALMCWRTLNSCNQSICDLYSTLCSNNIWSVIAMTNLFHTYYIRYWFINTLHSFLAPIISSTMVQLELWIVCLHCYAFLPLEKTTEVSFRVLPHLLPVPPQKGKKQPRLSPCAVEVIFFYSVQVSTGRVIQ